MKFNLFIITVGLFLSTVSCIESLQEKSEFSSVDSINHIKQDAHWGNKIENPYTVQNMCRAYDELMNCSGSTIAKYGFSKNQIITTHLYLKFIPKNMEELRILKSDSFINVVPVPLDYDLDGFDGIYRDPECPNNQPTYQYAVVRIEHILPNIEYVVLDSLYMPYEDEYYGHAYSKSSEQLLLWEQLELSSMKLTGNYSEDDYVPESISKKYYPDGRVTYFDEELGKNVPIANARVHVNFSTHTHNCYTNANGEFRSKKKYMFNVHFHVYFENENLEVCHPSMGDVIGSYGGKSTNCKNFHIDTDEKKGAAATHVAGYEFFNRYHGGLLTNISNKKNTHFVSNNIGKQNEIVFTNDNVGVKFCNPIYSPTSLRFGDAIYAFAGFVLEDYNKQFIGYWDNSLVKAWCSGVEWFVAKDYYETFDDRQGLVRDLIDSDNSTHDNVSGLSIEALNKCMLNTYTWDGFKNKVKLLVSSDSEKNNIDELFSYWKSLY